MIIFENIFFNNNILLVQSTTIFHKTMRAVASLSLWLLASSALATEEGGEWEENSRLPSHLLPLHYDLYLHPDLQEGTFKGL